MVPYPVKASDVRAFESYKVEARRVFEFRRSSYVVLCRGFLGGATKPQTLNPDPN